jgi:hypothetical protein
LENWGKSVNQDLLLIVILVAALFGAIGFMRSSPKERSKKINFSLVAFLIGLGSLILGVFGVLGHWQGIWFPYLFGGSILADLGFAGLIANMAHSKGRSWTAFFWLSLLFTPILMWIIAATVSPLPGSKDYLPINGNIAIKSETLDPVDQIKKLGKLREQGLLTEEEFLEKKTDLLTRI